MKKSISILLMSFMLANAGFCAQNTSDNSFIIRINEVPPGSPKTKKSDGLSSGVVTAIALGSVAGSLAALGGLTYFFLYSGLSLAQGSVTGASSPINTICLDSRTLLEKLKLSYSKYNYLIKAIEKNELKACKMARYLVVEDTSITNKTYNSVIFELPDFPEGSVINVRLTQISDAYSMNGKIPSLDSKILKTNDIKTPVEYPMYISSMDSKDGVLIKQGQITRDKDKTAVLVTSYNRVSKNAPPQKYAILVEFSL